MNYRVLAGFLLIILCLILVGCSGRRSIAGKYVFSPDTRFYIELKGNGQYYFDTTSGSTLPIWEWPMGIALSFPKEGTWRMEEGSVVVLRSGGTEYPFGEVHNDEIVDIFGSIWVKQE